MTTNEMILYVDASGIQMYATDGDPPEGGVAVSSIPEYSDQVWLFPGWGSSLLKATQVENNWREAEMPIAKNNVTAIQFGENGIAGTEQQWKDYWLALRKWTQDNPDFPDVTKRPTSPE